MKWEIYQHLKAKWNRRNLDGKLRKNVTEKMRETGGQARDCFREARVATSQRLGRQELRIPCGVYTWIWSSLTSECRQADWARSPCQSSGKRPLYVLAPELWSKGYLLWQFRQSRLGSFRGAWSLVWIKEVLAYVWVQSRWLASGKKQSLVQSLTWLIFLAQSPEHQLSWWCMQEGTRKEKGCGLGNDLCPACSCVGCLVFRWCWEVVRPFRGGAQ